MASRQDVARKVTKGPARVGWIAAGHVCVALGVVGAVLPLLPTTIFILGAAACYARGSQRFHKMLLNHRVFGPIIRDWQERRGMSAGAKRWAVAAIIVTISISILALNNLPLRITLALVAIALIAYLLRIPTVPKRGDAVVEVQETEG